MEKRIIPVILAAGVLVLPVLFTGCGLFGFTRDANLKALEGRGYDVNGDTTLDFKGNRMTISYGERRKEGFRVRVTDTPVKYIENATLGRKNDKTFGMISAIEISEDGKVLTACEQILDADGHYYRFVREEDLEKEKAYEDLSKDLPKTIESDAIKSFSLSFSLEDTRFDVPKDTEWYSGVYSIDVKKNDDGTYWINFGASGDSYIIYRYEGEVSEEYVRGLAALIQEQKIPEHNCMYIRNNERFDSWSLDVKYESDEKLRLTASGRPALECPFSMYAFLKYADQVIGYTQPQDETTAEGVSQETETTASSGSAEDAGLNRVQGHWVDLNSDATLDFDGTHMTLSLFAGDKDEYEVRVGGSADYRQIENADEESGSYFGLMSAIHVNNDGTLTAYEMILDADGHTFRFVREENLEKERAVEDLSSDAPKVIESDDINEFFLHFSLEDTRFDVPDGSPWYDCVYNFEITKYSDGTYEMSFEAMGDSYVLCQYKDTVSEDYVKGLAALIREQKIPEHNGMYLSNNEDFDSWSPKPARLRPPGPGVPLQHQRLPRLREPTGRDGVKSSPRHRGLSPMTNLVIGTCPHTALLARR